nr:hypothetical protein CFP56_51890 [Quercus suber]
MNKEIEIEGCRERGKTEEREERVSVIHRSELRPSHRQSSTTSGNRESPQIDGNQKGSTLRRQWCNHQGTRKHRNRYRSRQRQHSNAGFQSKHSDSVDELECVALLPGQEHHAHHRWERGHDLDGPRADLAATSDYTKCPECPQLGGWPLGVGDFGFVLGL